ncbi:hypothetical protein C8R45DRAFT_1092093 [Mycena sanguinolenta]|nr:hypothetical protein C8R45DRAFT_1092093 [Mycena sanguinolenta]
MSLQPKSGVFKPADSPFFGLFEQNRVPSLEERKTIQQLLAEKTAHLSHLNSQVPKRRPGKKHKILSDLRAELAYTRRWLDFHRALASPWRQLPVEIMSEIFILTLKSREILDQDEPWIDDRAGTLLLCKICSVWRAIALMTPALWNTVSVRLSNLKCPFEWVSTWLTRSRCTPVYLQLFWNHRALPNAINSVVSVFVSHLHHTTGLSINGFDAGFDIFDLDYANDIDEEYPKLTSKPLVPSPLRAPLLSTVVVRLPRGSVWDWIYAACRASPCLTHLATSQTSLDSFPVANLTKLKCTRRTPMSQVFKIFEDAPNLRHVDINVGGPAVPSSPQSRLIVKSVTKLSIASYEHLGEFLEPVEFPSLVNLHMRYVDEWPGPSFHSFLSRSSCALTVLEFHGCVISPTEIVTCLQHSACKTLELFSMDQCSEDVDVLLRHLTYHGPEHSPCSNPNLRTIILHNINSTDGLISAMVESRCSPTVTFGPPGPVRLTEVRFSFFLYSPDTDHPEDWKRLREMEKMKGPELKIGWPHRFRW